MNFFKRLFFGNETNTLSESGTLSGTKNRNEQNQINSSKISKEQDQIDLSKIRLELTRFNDSYEILLDNQSGIDISIKSISCKIGDIVKQDETVYLNFSSPSLKKIHTVSIKLQFEIGIVEFVSSITHTLQSSEALVKINFTKEAIEKKLFEKKREKFKNFPIVKEDPFVGFKNFKWEYTGGIFDADDYGKYGIVTSSDDGFLLIISFIQENEKIYLLLNYFTDTLSTQNSRFKIFENDQILFLFDDKSIKEFTIKDKTFKPLDKKGFHVNHRKLSGLHQNSIEINKDTLNIFASKNLIAWKLNIKKYNLEIIGNKSGHSHYGNFEDCQFSIRNLASDLLRLISLSPKELKDHIESIEKNRPQDKQDTYSAKEYDPDDRDPMFEEAARLIVMHQQGSTSLIQRKMKLGYNRAGRIIDQLEAAGIVGAFEGSKARDVLYPDEYSLERYLETLQKPKD